MCTACSVAGAFLDVVTFGEAMACFVSSAGEIGSASDFTKSIGGAEANTSIGLARLGDSACWISRVSTDPLGDEIVSVLAAEGVDVSHVLRTDAAQTGLMLKDRLSADSVRVFYYRQGSAATHLASGDIGEGLLASAKILHVTGISLSIGDGPRELALQTMKDARRLGLRVTFDPNFRPQLVSAEAAVAQWHEILPLITDFLCNEEEARLISGKESAREAVEYITSKGPSAAIVKRGALGAVALVDGDYHEVPAWPALDPRDPVGAGDAFNAGWIHARLHDFGHEASLSLAAFVASQVVQHPGDYEGFPHIGDVQHWLTSQVPDHELAATAEEKIH
jgi:2-dehydro-3-deoxygluconokinase